MKASVLATLVVLNLFNVSCVTKGYIRHQVSPLTNHVNELDDGAAEHSRDLKAAEDRFTEALNAIVATAATSSERVSNAGLRARAARDVTAKSGTKIRSLEATLANVDKYRSLAERSVQFQFGQKALNLQSQEVLDELVANIPKTPNYLIVVEGATDATGQAEYNIALSQQRAEMVVRYLAIKHNISLYRMRWIGIGVNKPMAPNDTPMGRAENRRANVTVLISPDFPEPQDQESDADDETWAKIHPEETHPSMLTDLAH
jgi:OOP family OmpA-OmpF porin